VSAAHVTVTGLVVEARHAATWQPIVDDVSFTIGKGEVLALIGESGSGKSTTALALMGYTRGGCRIRSGTVQVGDTSVLALGARQLEALRGKRVAYIAQSAAAAFNPSRNILAQVTEAAVVHGLLSRRDAAAKAVELFGALALPDPQQIGRRYPHQVSGGQLQRLLAAMALMTDPELVILDEPTTALDVTTQIEVLRVLKAVIKDRGTTALYVSHDLAVVAQLADQIVVLNHGKVRESGGARQLLEAPQDAYTQQLIAAARPTGIATRELARNDEPLLRVDGLSAGYGARDAAGNFRVPVLWDISFTIPRGKTLGVIGESGSGKSTLARVIAGLMTASQGAVCLGGVQLSPQIATRMNEQIRRIQIVFQNADTALNPAHSVARILGRPLQRYLGLKGAALHARITELLELVQLPPDCMNRLPSELSGGQKQRVNLARALAAEPDLILCDEVTSALDSVVGAAILQLMADLQRRLKISFLFISHDISTVRAICDEIIVLYAGRTVESVRPAQFGDATAHPYTQLLIASVPELRPGWLEGVAPTTQLPTLQELSADAVSQYDQPSLCAFLSRCPERREGICNRSAPKLVALPNDMKILCHRAGPAWPGDSLADK
jgi:peptide/nickel transport system ATP-binding protein